MSLGEYLARHGLLLATRNEHKRHEFARLLESRGIRVFGLPATAPETPETENTFAGNAALKARAAGPYADAHVVLADDSGIAVDALGGRPGIHSARYGGPELDDVGRLQHLLNELAGVPDERRTARYVCVLALYAGHLTDSPLAEDPLLFEGRCEGRIARSPRGTGGFGYDPIFFDPELGQTFAEIAPAVKDARSHRGRALARFLAALDG